MSITTCKVLHKLNDSQTEELNICTQWSTLSINILIIKSDMRIFTGEIQLQEFTKYAKAFNKPLELYLGETKDILSGFKTDVEFLLKENENKFLWKRNRWCLGQITIQYTEDFKCLTNFALLCIDHCTKVNNSIVELQSENTHLKNMHITLNNQLEELTMLKDTFEVTLYKKFILLLNAKKSKIRLLKSTLNSLNNVKDSIFDKSTDESESESENTVDNNLVNCTSPKTQIKKIIKTNSEIIKNVSCDEISKTDRKLVDLVIKDSSCSLEEDEETPDFFSDESECEVELQFEEEKTDNSNKNDISAINEQESEEMF